MFWNCFKDTREDSNMYTANTYTNNNNNFIKPQSVEVLGSKPGQFLIFSSHWTGRASSGRLGQVPVREESEQSFLFLRVKYWEIFWHWWLQSPALRTEEHKGIYFQYFDLSLTCYCQLARASHTTELSSHYNSVTGGSMMVIILPPG